MICSISGHPCEEAVVSIKGGHVFEKKLILEHLRNNEGQCPVCDDVLTPEDLVDVVLSPRQRPLADTHSKSSSFNSVGNVSMSSEADLSALMLSPRGDRVKDKSPAVNVDIELLKKRKRANSYLMAPDDFTLCKPPPEKPYKYFGASADMVQDYMLSLLRADHDVQIVAEDHIQKLYTFVEKMTVITVQFVDTDIRDRSESTIAAYARSVYHLSKFQEKQIHRWCDKIAMKFPGK